MGNIERRLNINEHMEFLMASSEFYEPLENLTEKRNSYKKIIQGLIPNTWEIKRIGIWYNFSPPKVTIPIQGFKIHISAVYENAKDILIRVVPICIKNNLPFKVIRDEAILDIVNGRNYDRRGSGKFITIYPPNNEVFKKVIEDIYQTLKGYKGPFILTDMPYKDSKVVFYRYGGFIYRYKINVFGEKIPVIVSPKGENIEDKREPAYSLPYWVKDPFGNKLDLPNEVLLKGEKGIYKIESVFVFSNMGGVYKGVNLKTNEPVVIKERRPYVGMTRQFKIDGIDLLRKEYQILKKLEDCKYVPNAIEIFKEWEHYFLVMEFVQGYTLAEYRAREDFSIMLWTNLSPQNIKLFCKEFSLIRNAVIKAVKALHKHGIIILDISPNNIIYNPDNGEVKIIDLEGAYMEGLPFYPLGTLGFMPKRKKASLKDFTFEDDYIAVENILYNLLYPITEFFTLSSSNKKKILKYIVKDKNLPEKFEKFILRSSVELKSIKNKKYNKHSSTCKETERVPQKKLKKVVFSIGNYILQNASYKRKDRLFPSAPKIFYINPLNISFGALGNCLFLESIYERSYFEEVIRWVRSKKIDIKDYPPGLGVGLAGIALGYLNIEEHDRAVEAMKLSYKSTLYNKALDIFYGISGIGLISLYFYKKTNDIFFLEKALEAADAVKKFLIPHKNGFFFENVDGNVYFGFMHGASGIAYFYSLLFLETKKDIFKRYAMGLLNFEISNSINRENGIGWPKMLGSNIIEPYYQIGSAGIGSVLIRCYDIFKVNRFKEIAEKTADYLRRKYSVLPSLYMGMAGIGEFFLDMYRFTNENKYLDEAHWVAKRILFFEVKRKEGLVFPGEGLERIATDYATGSAGIGMFFQRLINKGKNRRTFFDIL